MRTLITGGGGQLASDLVELLGGDAVALSHAELDVADGDALARAIDVNDRSMLTDPRYYNIRWLELMHELQPNIEHFGALV